MYSLERAYQLLKKDGTIWIAGTVYLNTGAGNSEAVLTLEGFGDKSIDNLLIEIENSKYFAKSDIK